MAMPLMKTAESEADRTLMQNEILNTVAENMKFYGIPMQFTTGRKR